MIVCHECPMPQLESDDGIHCHSIMIKAVIGQEPFIHITNHISNKTLPANCPLEKVVEVIVEVNE